MPMSHDSSPKKESLLVVSDGHRGFRRSQLVRFEAELIEKMKGYEHVVFNGDMFELFYVDPHANPVGNGRENRDRVRTAIKESKKWLEDFLKENPKVQMHFVMGNHENIRKFRYTLDSIAKRYDNFEWDPEGIRIGDALFTHGDLQMGKKTADKRGEYRLRDASFPDRWNKIFSTGYLVGRPIVEAAAALNSPVRRVHKYLHDRDKMEEFRVLHKGERKKLEMDKIKHVFFGHTHVKFFAEELGGKTYYNTGSFVHGMSTLADSGLLEAELSDGRLENIRPLGTVSRRAAGRG